MSSNFLHGRLLTFLGSAHDDTYSGQFGVDETVKTANGDDRVITRDGIDIIHTGDGADHVRGGAGSDHLEGADGNDRLLGEDGSDSIFGGHGNDRVSGGADDDTLWGSGGNDRLSGGDGSDKLSGGHGNDKGYGGAGADQLIGGDGNDLLFGGLDNDLLQGSTGRDRLFGGQGADKLMGGSGRDQLSGGEGNDRLHGGDDNDLLFGGAGNDTLFGENGSDDLYGGNGDDWLIGRAGSNRLYGGEGSDGFRFDAQSTGTTVVEDYVFGEDKITLSEVSVVDIVDSDQGAVMHLSSGGQVLFRGAKVHEIGAETHSASFQILGDDAEDAPQPGQPLPIYVLAGQSNASPLFVGNVVSELTNGLDTLDPVYGMVSLAVSRTGIDAVDIPLPDWNVTSEGELYDQLVAALVEAKVKARDAGYEPDIKGLFWLHGEKDSKTSESSEEYIDNLSHFIEQLQKDVDDAITFVLSEVRTTSNAYGESDTVREAQSQIAEAYDNVLLVETDEFELRDAAHYSEAGMVELMDAMIGTMAHHHEDVELV